MDQEQQQQQWHQSYPSPIYNSGMAEPDFERDVTATKWASSASTRSPTAVFAVSGLHGVFRVPDGAAATRGIDDDDDEEGGRGCRQLPLPSFLCSFATDGELSTFSEDTEEGSSSAAPQSIFRPVSLTKRRCEYLEDESGGAPAPPLRRATPIGGSDDDASGTVSEDVDGPQDPAVSFSFASPFKRIRRRGGAVGLSRSGAGASLDRGVEFSIAPRRPASLGAPLVWKGSDAFQTDGRS